MHNLPIGHLASNSMRITSSVCRLRITQFTWYDYKKLSYRLHNELCEQRIEVFNLLSLVGRVTSGVVV